MIKPSKLLHIATQCNFATSKNKVTLEQPLPPVDLICFIDTWKLKASQVLQMHLAL